MKNYQLKIIVMTLIMITIGIVTTKVWAYFTTSVSASGGSTIELGEAKTQTTIEERDNKKIIYIENIGQVPCYVRLKIITSREDLLNVTSNNCTKGEDWYWYDSHTLKSGEKKEVLIITKESTKEINARVVTETTNVLYKEDGSEYADWNKSYRQ